MGTASAQTHQNRAIRKAFGPEALQVIADLKAQADALEQKLGALERTLAAEVRIRREQIQDTRAMLHDRADLIDRRIEAENNQRVFSRLKHLLRGR